MKKISHAGDLEAVDRLCDGKYQYGVGNAYQDIFMFRLCVFAYLAYCAFVLGLMLSGTALSLYGVILAFPAAVSWVGLVIMFPRYAQARLLVRGYKLNDDAWLLLAKASLPGESKLPLYVAAITYPFWAVVFLIQDTIRALKFIKATLSGEKVRFGRSEFLFYKRQAKTYNRLKQTMGAAAADRFLLAACAGTDIPLIANGVSEHWHDGSLRNTIMEYKEGKYGPMESYGV